VRERIAVGPDAKGQTLVVQQQIWGSNPMQRIDEKPKRRPNRVWSLRVLVQLPPAEHAAIKDFRFSARLPSFAAAARELLRRGLTASDD
jgi:hypothetical protein